MLKKTFTLFAFLAVYRTLQDLSASAYQIGMAKLRESQKVWDLPGIGYALDPFFNLPFFVLSSLPSPALPFK